MDVIQVVDRVSDDSQGLCDGIIGSRDRSGRHSARQGFKKAVNKQ